MDRRPFTPRIGFAGLLLAGMACRGPARTGEATSLDRSQLAAAIVQVPGPG